MRYGELIRKLRPHGIEFFRQAKGSHEIWWQPATGRRASIPNHATKEIAAKTLTNILRDFGLTDRDFG